MLFCCVISVLPSADLILLLNIDSRSRTGYSFNTFLSLHKKTLAPLLPPDRILMIELFNDLTLAIFLSSDMCIGIFPKAF